MIIERLDIEDNSIVHKIMDRYGIKEFDSGNAYVRIWGRGRAIQIDGDLTTKELKCLADIAEFLNCVEYVF